MLICKDKLICKDSPICKLANKTILANKRIFHILANRLSFANSAVISLFARNKVSA